MARYIIGIDSGGTFTDCVVTDSTGRVTIGKSPSTPSDLSLCVIDSIKDAATTLGVKIEALLKNTRSFNYGTTATTNALLTRTGAKTGLITTKGFEDTLFIGRLHQKVAGLTETELIHAAKLDKAVPIIPRTLVKGVTERIDYAGQIVVPLNLLNVKEAVMHLRQENVEAISVCLLWSFINPVHEQKIKKVIKGLCPEILVSLSSELSPRMGEYERMATTALNGYLGNILNKYIMQLEGKLQRLGLKCPLRILHSGGGVMSSEEIIQKSAVTLKSGPVGGINAALFWGRTMGYKNILCTDVGGTSFDAGLIVGGEPEYARESVVDKYHTFIPMIDVSSIGTGGGSIAWIEPVTGILRVGPQSAGANPGPACYGKGGTEPTLTDAGVILGYINPDYFLGGRIKLNKEKASSAIESRVARPLGLDVLKAAMAIYRISNSQLADLVRKLTIEKGYDPRHFTLFAYGGAGPQYAGIYSAELGIREVIISLMAAAYSAFGAAASDISVSFSRSLPLQLPVETGQLAGIYRELERNALSSLGRMGFKGRTIKLQRSVEMRYRRQVHEVRVPIPSGDLTPRIIARVVDRFEQRYEELYGKGSGYREAGIEMATYNLVGTGLTPKPGISIYPKGPADPSSALKGMRPAYFQTCGKLVDTRIYDGARLRCGNVIKDMAIIETPTTTIVIQPGQTARVDEYLNIVIKVMKS